MEVRDIPKLVSYSKCGEPSTMIHWIIKVTPEEKAEFLHSGTPS